MPLLQDLNKSLMSPECVREVLAQNTNVPKCMVLCVPLNANELALPTPFSKEGKASRAPALAYKQQQNNQSHALKMSETLNPTCDYELDKFTWLTSHCFHMQFLTSTFLFTIILVACEGSISENRQKQW